MSVALPDNGRTRAIIEKISPEVDAGRFPIKRAVGELVRVEADVFVDGHEALTAVLEYRKAGTRNWHEVAMEPLVNDRYTATFRVEEMANYEYRIAAWLDPFRAWRRDLQKRRAAGQVTTVDIEIGLSLIAGAAKRAKGQAAKSLQKWIEAIRASEDDLNNATALALDEEMGTLTLSNPDRSHETISHTLRVRGERHRALFSSWYELFPRSTAEHPGQHGTFRTLLGKLDRIAAMGFDIVYLPPIHPIGVQYRKGRNNNVRCEPGDVGSPWAIGGKEGGHTAIHPDLGSFEDFAAVVERTRELGMEIALDIAYQCSADHPWVKEHPGFFKSRPDGTIQYAENPPKKYQDIYPINFDTDDWKSLWKELLHVMLFWCEKGVRVFRVDNPHTKAFRFWEWAIAAVHEKYPEVIFLSEAFTRPKVMHQLAKLGFTQSYTYFTWRTSKWELTEYLAELTKTDSVEYFRPNFWPNTPDILHESLQHGGRPTFMARAVLASTMTSNWGIYGPAFELCENTPREPGSEEYLDSEKYQVRWRDLNVPWSLEPLITKLNAIRKANHALQQMRGCEIHHIDNDALICYSKRDQTGENVILVVVNLDPNHTHGGWTYLNMGALGMRDDSRFRAHDLLADVTYHWHGPGNFVMLDPHKMPAHVFRIEKD